MTQLLNVSRAARLAGVTRSQIQKKIGSGELETFEGEVKITDLLRVFPQIDLDRDPTLEHMKQIKANARPKFPWEQDELPSVEVLLRRMQSLTDLLVQTKSQLDRNALLLDSAARSVEELRAGASLDEGARMKIDALHQLLSNARSNGDREPDDAAKLFTKNLLLHIVAPSVQLIPSGHEFLIEGGDTILGGAIRSGLNVAYGCNNASCGGCKARVISGQVIETRTPEFKLSEHEEQMGYKLMCCNTAVTDLMLEVGETSSPKDLPRQSVETRVSGIEPLSDEMTLLHLRTPKAQNFRFFAGQNATLNLTSGETMTLPIASCPCDGENLHFHVPTKPAGDRSIPATDKLERGETVTVTGPEGEFILRDGSSSPAIFIACDGGFAPVKSLIEHAISIDKIESFHLYRYATPGNATYYHNLCRAWRDAFDNFNYTTQDLNGDPGRAASNIVADIPDLSGFDAYVAGPREFAEGVKQAMLENGLAPERLSVEILSD